MDSLPYIDRLPLRAVGEELAVDAAATPHLWAPRLLDHRPAAPRLTVLFGDDRPPARASVEALLEDFLRAETARRLGPRLMALADRAGIPRPSAVRVARQKTRWASRSSSGTVSLSVLLLFLPAPVADHVLLHELCHVVHMDHSPAFHALLEKLDPLARAHDASLRTADRDYVPRWINPRAAPGAS
ncbi:MAG: DUF45 domain-containing protein [Kiritimatiellae bacterium]|nr:DUF45 domain-containing protein [Kiritimatiellia bacterium]